jgi:hypothetical protein
VGTAPEFLGGGARAPPSRSTAEVHEAKEMVMRTENERLAHEGYESLMRGEIEPLERLLAPDVDWRWWEPGPWDCHGRDQAIAVIRERLGQGAIGDVLELTEVEPGKVLVMTRTRPEAEIRPEDLGLAPGHEVTATVVTFRDGRVVAMQNHRTREDAMRAVHGAADGD